MNIGVISDIHDRTDHLQLVMEEIDKGGCEIIIFLGDLEEPSTLISLIKLGNGRPLHIILGNNDSEINRIKGIVGKNENITFHGIRGHTTIDHLRIGMSHYPSIAEQHILSEDYDVVLHGHTHIASCKTIRGCILANPGEIQGRTGQIGYGILDTQQRTFVLHRLSF